MEKYFEISAAQTPPRYKGIAVLDEPFRKKYEEILARAKVDLGTVTPLQIHAAFFVDPNSGFICVSSIKECLKDLGYNWLSRTLLAYVIAKCIANFTGETENTITLNNIHKVIHPADSNILWTNTGGVCIDNFQKIAGFGSDGKFTFQDLKDMRAANYNHDEKKEFSGLFSAYLDAKKEFDLALDLFADTTKNGERAISLETIAKIYLAGPQAFEEAILRKRETTKQAVGSGIVQSIKHIWQNQKTYA